MRRRPSITDGAAERWLRQRYNPWANMTPETLARAFDEWDQGWLRRGALMWENRAERDEVLAGAVPKRCGSVARLPWTVLTVDDSPAAARHQEALEAFFDRGITATDALDLDQRGGMRLLIEQAMDAVFVGKSVHEIIWRPGRMDVSAELRSVPLYFFEQLSGRLRYTGPDMTTRGEDLDEGGWMIASKRRRLFKAALMCCLFKSMSLSDWIGYSGRFGQPGVHGETDADPGSEEWGRAEEMVAAFAAEWAALTRTGTKINLIETGKNPNAPYEPMVERMSRILSMLCRGADLGTMSSREGAGASLQADESDLLLEDDCQMVSEALQHHLARPVIRHLFGADPLAYIEIQVPSDSDTKAEIAVDEALSRLGVSQDPEALAERYGRTVAAGAAGYESRTDAENDAAADDDDETLAALGEVLRAAVSERERTRLYVAIREVLTGGGDLVRGLEDIRGRLPEFLGPHPDAELAFERFSAAAMLQGWGEAADRSASAMQIHANRAGDDKGPVGAENDRGGSESTQEGFFDLLKRLANAKWNARHPAGTPSRGKIRGGRFALGKGTSRERRTKPTKADVFGRVPEPGISRRDNVRRGEKAVAWAMRHRRDVQGMMWREDVGTVDLPWGRPGHGFPTQKPNAKGELIEATHRDGYGASHILDKHGESALRRLPVVLADGKVRPPTKATRIEIEKDGWLLVLGRENADRAFAVTHFDQAASAPRGQKPLRAAVPLSPMSKVRQTRTSRRSAAFAKRNK